jgi:hypothetical protein
LVDAGIGADLICSAIGGKGPEGLSTAAGVVAAVVLDYVVLGLRGVNPAVDGEVGTSVGGV